MMISDALMLETLPTSSGFAAPMTGFGATGDGASSLRLLGGCFISASMVRRSALSTGFSE